MCWGSVGCSLPTQQGERWAAVAKMLSQFMGPFYLPPRSFLKCTNSLSFGVHLSQVHRFGVIRILSVWHWPFGGTRMACSDVFDTLPLDLLRGDCSQAMQAPGCFVPSL